MYRTESFDKELSRKLQNSDYAREYLLASMEGEDGMSLIEALIHTISLMGTKEFSDLSGITAANISRMLSKGEIPKIETLNGYLTPFKLRAKYEVEEVA